MTHVDGRDEALFLRMHRSDGLAFLRTESFMIQHHQMVIGRNRLESFWSSNQDILDRLLSFLEGTRDLVR